MLSIFRMSLKNLWRANQSSDTVSSLADSILSRLRRDFRLAFPLASFCGSVCEHDYRDSVSGWCDSSSTCAVFLFCGSLIFFLLRLHGTSISIRMCSLARLSVVANIKTLLCWFCRFGLFGVHWRGIFKWNFIDSKTKHEKNINDKKTWNGSQVENR